MKIFIIYRMNIHNHFYVGGDVITRHSDDKLSWD